MREGLDDINKNDGMLRMASELSIATQMTEPLRAGLQAALDVPSQKAGNLESAMAAVNSVLTEQNAIGGDLGKTYSVIEQAALDWSAGSVSGSKLATAAADKFSQTTYGMISAGLSAEAAIAATGQSLILAKGTMGQATDAANLLGVMYNNLGNKSADSGDELQRLSDIVAKTQGTFQIANLNQLSEGLKYAIPVAKQFRIETAQLSAVVGQLNTAGLQGSMAGTAFSAMMNNMSKASGKLGFDIAYDASGGIDIISTLKNIETAMGPLDSLSQEASDQLNSAFGTEGVRAVSLLGSALDKLDVNYKAVLNSQGESANMAESMSDTYEESLDRLSNAAGVWQTKMGQGANGVKRAFVDMAAGSLSALSPLLNTPVGGFLAEAAGGATVFANAGVGFISTGLQMSSQLALISSAASNAGGYMKLFKNSIGLVGNVAKLAGAPFGAMFNGIVKLGSGFVAGVPKALSFAAAQLAVAWPVLAVVAGIAAAIAIGVLLYKNWDKISEKARQIGASIKNGFGAAIDWVSAKITKFTDFVKAPFEAAADFGQKVFGFFSDGVKKESPKLEVATAQAMDNVDAYFPHSNARKGPLSRLSESGKSLIRTFLDGAGAENINAGKTVQGLAPQFGSGSGGGTIIHIDKVLVNAEEIENMKQFIDMLLAAGGVA